MVAFTYVKTTPENLLTMKGEKIAFCPTNNSFWLDVKEKCWKKTDYLTRKNTKRLKNDKSNR